VTTLRVACLVLLAAAGCKKPRPLFERIFALEEIPAFSIDLAPDAVEALAQRPREWVRGTFAYQDERIDPAGIRLKGHRSLRKLGAKSSFKIQLDRFGKHKLAKQTTITLNNMVEDPTMMREVLAYRLYRALGVAAPSAGFAEVTVNGEPQGLYAVIESIDKKFLKARFGDPGGPIYEGEWGCDIVPEDVGGFDHDGGTKDRTALARFAQIAAGPADELFGEASPLDVAAFLRFLAVEMYVGNFDGYRHGHNYRLYFEPAKQRWYFIPWGLDRTFVKSLSIFDSQGYLAKRCFTDAACRAAYVRAMRDVVAEARRLRLEDGVDVIGVVTDQAAGRDPGRRADLRKKRAALRAFLVERPAEVERELTCLDAGGKEVDRDGDGYSCLDCNDAAPAIHPGAAETRDGADNDCNGLVDDGPAFACDRIEAAGVALSLCPLPLPYADAQRFCAARGEALARIDDEPQRRALTDALSARRAGSITERWWIGLDDRADEGKFRWLAPAPDASFSAWRRGEPDNSGCNQDCAVMDADDGRWGDTHCLEHHPFVCRAP
jgi:hypothetical protein